MIKFPTHCKECGGNDLEWYSGIKNVSSCSQGRLNTSDVVPIFYLGCNECSETLLVVDGDIVADALNESCFKKEKV